MKHIIHRQVKRGSRYEVWVSFYDDQDNLILGNHIVSLGKSELDEKALDIFIKERVYPSLVHQEPEQMISVGDVAKILREKGYLLSEESFDDLGMKDG